MKVRELIEKLKQQDPELEILCYSEDTNLLPPKHGFRLFHIENVTNAEGEKVRVDDQIPYLKFGKSSISQKLAIIEITSDF